MLRYAAGGLIAAQTRESREVAIVRTERQPVFDRQSRPVGVQDQLGPAAEGAQQPGKDGPVRGAGSRRPGAFAIQPRLHVTPRYCYRLGALEDPRIRYDPHIGEQTLPRQSGAGISA